MDHVPTGCRALDELLGGGVETGCITLLYGEAGSGKTNVVLQVARLLRVSRKSEIPVVLTSQVYTDIERGTIEPLGGHMLSHNCKTLVRLEKVGPALRRAVRVKHRHLAEGHAVKFRLTDRGVEDA